MSFTLYSGLYIIGVFIIGFILGYKLGKGKKWP